MSLRVIAIAVLFVFIIVGLFGLTSLLSHTDHHAHCPLQGATTVLCESTTIEHIGMWQGMFVATLFLLVFALAVLLLSSPADMRECAQKIRLRRAHLQLPRPTLLQELFSAGILNRKEPYASLSRLLIN